MKSALRRQQLGTNLRTDLSRPKQRLAASVKEKHERAFLGAALGTVAGGMQQRPLDGWVDTIVRS